MRLTARPVDHSVWFAEHHGTPWNACSDPLMLAAHVAGRTSRIMLGTAIVNLTLHHPRSVAVERGSCSRCRVSGCSSGSAATSTSDYTAFDVAPVRASEIFNDNHERLHAALAETGPPPPMWLATSGAPPSLRLAAKHRYGLLLAGNGPKLVACVTEFREQWRRLYDDRPRIAVFRAVHVADSMEQARDEIVGHVAWYVDQMSRLQPGQPSPAVDEVMATFCMLGSPAECAEAARALHAETGATDLVCVFGIGGAPRELAMNSMERFVNEAGPALAAVA